MLTSKDDAIKKNASAVFSQYSWMLTCSSLMYNIVKNVNTGFDSFGKVQSGLTEGNYGWYGSFDQCEGISAKVPMNGGVQNQ